MGKFIGIIAATLDMRDGQFIQITELLDFEDEVWVYYCRPHLGEPKPGWTDLADGTLRVSLGRWPLLRQDTIEWQPDIARDETAGSWEYAAEVMGVEPGNNVFHLALPPGMLPVADSWDVPPLYGHADGDRFVIGWSIEQRSPGTNRWPIFRFEPVAPEVFPDQAHSMGRAIRNAAVKQPHEALTPGRPPGDEYDGDQLLERLRPRLNLDDVKTLVLELGIDYDELAGETKTGKLRELILYMQRQDQLPRLLSHLRDRYPHILRE